MLDQDIDHWLSKPFAFVSPRHELQGKMSSFELPLLIDKRDRTTNKTVSITFGCPHVVLQANVARQVLWYSIGQCI